MMDDFNSNYQINDREENKKDKKRHNGKEEIKSNSIKEKPNIKSSRIPRPRSCNGFYFSGQTHFVEKDSFSCPHSRSNSLNLINSKANKQYYIDKPFQNVRRKTTKTKNECNKDMKTITSFRRSLKLLGLKLEDFGIKDSDNISDLNSSERTSSDRSIPKLQTRIIKRTVSLNDLQNVVHKASLNKQQILDEIQRETLSKAVYEEWYFNKQKLLKEEKLKEIEKKKQEEEQIKLKEEKKKSAEENFIQWQQKKRLEKSKNTEKQTSSFRKTLTKEEAETAYKAWKMKKEQELKEQLKKEKEKLIQEEKSKQIKKKQKEDAEKAYEIWKEKQKLEMKTVQQKNNEIIKKERDKKKNEENERKKGAELSFNHWKKFKDEEINRKIKEKRHVDNYENKMKVLHLAERKVEAMEAYNDWLERIAYRESLEEERKQRSETRRHSLIPWMPSGKI